MLNEYTKYTRHTKILKKCLAFAKMFIAFHVNLTSFFKFSCHLNEAVGTILLVKFSWLYSAVAFC